jgi:hypothetical protein
MFGVSRSNQKVYENLKVAMQKLLAKEVAIKNVQADIEAKI